MKVSVYLFVIATVLISAFFLVQHFRLDAPTLPEEGVALGERVEIGAVAITPKEVLEDSRCPEGEGVACIWEGRLMISAELEATATSSEEVLTQGSTSNFADEQIRFVRATPEAKVEEDIAPGEYRFFFERALE